MRLTAELHYPAAPSAVLAMLTDPAFHERKCREGHAVSHDVAVTAEGMATRVIVRRAQTTEEFPSFVKGFVGERLTIVETCVWQAVTDDTYEATVLVEISGAPVVLRARGLLVPGPDGASTTQTVEGDLKASVPFLGAKIEQAAEPAIRAAIRHEERTGQAWLSGR